MKEFNFNETRKNNMIASNNVIENQIMEWKPENTMNDANMEMEEMSDNDAFALNDKDDLFLSELGNILLEEEKFSDNWQDNNDEDIQQILASCERKKEPLKKQNSFHGSPSRSKNLTPNHKIEIQR